MSGIELLQPDPTNAREMEVFSSVPFKDQQAWLTFWRQATENEQLGVAPAYTFDQFEDGIAPHQPGIVGLVDSFVDKGITGVPIVNNYRDYVEVNGLELGPVLGAFDATKEIVDRELKKGPLALVTPHTSLASPFVVARSYLETHGQCAAENLFIVIGPRPAVMTFESYSRDQDKIVEIPPVLFGRALGNVVLTGPDTDSTRKNPELARWLRELRKNFWKNLFPQTPISKRCRCCFFASLGRRKKAESLLYWYL